MTRSGIEPTTSRSRGERSNHWATAAVTAVHKKCSRNETFSLFIVSLSSYSFNKNSEWIQYVVNP